MDDVSLYTRFQGYPIVFVGKRIERIFAEIGWPVTANLRALLRPYFSSKSRLARLFAAPNPASTEHGLVGFLDCDTEDFYQNIFDAYNFIRRLEREECSPAEPLLSIRLQDVFNAGYTRAVWYAVRFSRESETPICQWTRDYLHEFLYESAKHQTLKNKKKGRPKGAKGVSTVQWREDLEICAQVNFWRDKVHDTSRSDELLFVSRDKAIRFVRAMRFPGDSIESEAHLEGLEKSYDRCTRRFSRVVIMPSAMNRWLDGRSVPSFRKIFLTDNEKKISLSG